MLTLFLILIVILFAINLGGSNFAASFAAAYGGRVLNKTQALCLFTFFVILGAATLGAPVSKTLGSKLISAEYLTESSVFIILLAATVSLLVGNLMHIPQSTSLIAVAAILGVGVFHGSVFIKPFYILIPAWILLPCIAYFLTYKIGKSVYPPNKTNFWIYEKLIHHEKRLKRFVIFAGCYNAYSVGANNVANAAGPIASAGLLDLFFALICIAPLFGLGGFTFHKSLENTSKKIVPLGLFTATLVSLICGTLMIFASAFGIPQSFVMIKMASLFAISSLKEGPEVTFQSSMTQKTYLSWLLTPCIAFTISYVSMYFTSN